MSHQEFGEPTAHAVKPGRKENKEYEDGDYLPQFGNGMPHHGLRRTAAQSSAEGCVQPAHHSAKGQHPGKEERERKHAVEPLLEVDSKAWLKKLDAPGNEESHN